MNVLPSDADLRNPGPESVHLRVGITAGQFHDVHGCADGRRFEDVPDAVHRTQVDRDVSGEPDDVTGQCAVPG